LITHHCKNRQQRNHCLQARLQSASRQNVSERMMPNPTGWARCARRCTLPFVLGVKSRERYFELYLHFAKILDMTTSKQDWIGERRVTVQISGINPQLPSPQSIGTVLAARAQLCHVLCVDDSSCTWKSEDDGSVSVLRVLQRWRRVTIQQLSIVESRVKEADLTSVSRLAVSTARSAGRRRDTTPSAHIHVLTAFYHSKLKTLRFCPTDFSIQFDATVTKCIGVGTAGAKGL